MKSDLEQIIEYLEGESKSLELSMKESLSEFDYLYAHYQQEGLGRLNAHLDTLKQFKDFNYGKKYEIEGLISWMRHLDNNKSVPVFEDDVAAKQREIDELNQNSARKYLMILR
jgi:molybdenum cofactor biosynthesis enzyme MoaA